MSNFKHHGGRNFQINGFAVVKHNKNFFAVFAKIALAIRAGRGNGKLFIRGKIHYYQIIALLVKKLHLPNFNIGLFNLLPRTEGVVLDAARIQIAQPGTHDSGSLAGFVVLRLHNFERNSVHFDFQAFLKISS